MPEYLYHGTPVAIHNTDRPFLDPYMCAYGGDDGDPQEPHVFATDDLLTAKLFTIKDRECRSITHLTDGPAIVFSNNKPAEDVGGWIYRIKETNKFNVTIKRDGKPTSPPKYACVVEDMPLLPLQNGVMVPGIPIDLIERVTLRTLISGENLRVYVLDETKISRKDYLERARQAEVDLQGNAVKERREKVFNDGIEEGWLIDVTKDIRKSFVEQQRFPIASSFMTR